VAQSLQPKALSLLNKVNLFIMEKLEKLALMDKVLRQLDDLKNSQTSLLKKLSQIEADNINLGASLLDKKLPDRFRHHNYNRTH
jgi:mRNA-degrading endonuclease RelE of RelBE toxin-antitoxin system